MCYFVFFFFGVVGFIVCVMDLGDVDECFCLFLLSFDFGVQDRNWYQHVSCDLGVSDLLLMDGEIAADFGGVIDFVGVVDFFGVVDFGGLDFCEF